MVIASMKPGMASWSSVTWVASVEITLPWTVKAFVAEEAAGAAVWRQPVSAAKRHRMMASLR